jgi:membrane protein
MLLHALPGRVLRKFGEDAAADWAVLIGWNALFAMFPIVLAMAALLGFALNHLGIASRVVYDLLLAALPEQAGRQEAMKALEGVQRQSGLLFVVGLVGLFWGGSALFGAMDRAFASVHGTKARGFVQQQLMSFGMMLLFTVLAGIAVGTSSLLPALKQLPGLPVLFASTAPALLIQLVIGIVMGFVLFSAVYFFVTNPRRPYRSVWPGALVAGVLFEVVTLIFPLYLSLNQNVNQYGKTFGLFFVLLTYFFLLGLITMVGVEVNSVLFPQEVPSSSGTEPGHLAQEAMCAPSTGIRKRTAVLLALAASAAGLLVGRRRAPH